MFALSCLLAAERSPRTLVSLGCLLVACCAGCQQFASSGQNATGVRLYQQGQYQLAYQNFQKAAATDPTSANAYYNMASTWHRQGNVTRDQNALVQAETLYNKCLDIDPNHTDCYRGLGVLLVETGRKESAFRLMQNWAARNPASSDARIELARLYQEFGDKKTAETYLVQALQVDNGQNARALRVLGSLREDAGDMNQALANYQRSYSLNALQPDLAQRIATLRGGAYGGFPTGYADTRTVTAPGGMPRY